MSGDLTVLKVARDTGAERVYNFTVETDHVYYVGDLTALTHNQCGKHVDGGMATVEQALDGAVRWLGDHYKDMGGGRYLSADGLRQFRMTAHELIKSIEKHVHFESFDKAGGSIVESNYVRLT
jgi:hypothetical protein